MRKRSAGFLLMEVIVALGIFCGVLMVLLLTMGRATDLAAMDAERVAAASRVDRVLEEARLGLTPLEASSEVDVARPAEEESLRNESCRLKTEPWEDSPGLLKLTVTLRWKTRTGRDCSASAVTLVNASPERIGGRQ